MNKSADLIANGLGTMDVSVCLHALLFPALLSIATSADTLKSYRESVCSALIDGSLSI